ncbi:MAG: TRAP transporter large permease [Candidatus Accumulibacter sp.]|nr:TRAP transporter large permease [Accumulibacter sp.]
MEVIFLIWLACILLGMPVYVSLGLAGCLHIFANDLNPFIIPQKIAMSANSFPLLATPFFILMGNLMNSSGITQRIFEFANVAVGWMRGGLGHANVLASVIFAGMSGTTVADAGGLGTIEVEAMRRRGYDDDFICAITSASATIGPIIPPSLPMVIYGVLAETSVGGLFMGGLLPGLAMALMLMFMVRHYAIKNDYPRETLPSLRDVWRAFRNAFWALMTPVLLLAGIAFGVFTPTEAAVFAAFFSLILGVFIYKELRITDIPKAVLGTVESNGVILALVMTAMLFAWDLSVAQVPQTIGAQLTAMSDNRVILLLMINVFLLFVGCFMEGIAAMMILVPILYPVAIDIGMSPIQFGIMVILNLMIGTVTPPIGVVLFVVSNVAKVSFDRVARATLPFLLPLLLVLMLVTFWAPLTTFLPGLLLDIK